MNTVAIGTWLIRYILPKRSLTLVAGYLADLQQPFIKNFLIRFFIKKYNVNLDEAREPKAENYISFNDFFTRRLRPQCRPISDAALVSPVDGAIGEMGGIQTGQLLQAKGKLYTVEELLSCDTQKCIMFNQGWFVTLYLSPKDYHRIHMPIDATLKAMTYIPGKLFPVKPAATQNIPKLFSSNERVVVYFETEVGPMVMVLVGATIVGSIGTTWHGDVERSKKVRHYHYSNQHYAKGDEIGYFKLGSTVIVLFAQDIPLTWQRHLKIGSQLQYGQALGEIDFPGK